MKPSKMKGRLTSCHPEHANKNWIKRRALNNRQFIQLCQEMGADHELLLYHTDVRWLSKGKVLQRVLDLRAEMCEFCSEMGQNEFHQLNLNLQGRDASVLELVEKLKAFIMKIQLWSCKLKNNK